MGDRLLIRRGEHTGAPAFTQNGQVDWVSFGNTIYQASFAVMQRLAAAGVQPVTHGGGLALASRFYMSDIGRKRMSEALRSLRSYPAFDSVIFFGFGYQSFVRLLAESQMGINCTALCSCLADTHSEELAAWVLRELWVTEDFPKEYEPSHSQLLALVKACAGVVAGTSFGETVYLMLGNGQRSSVTLARSASGARDIASALHGLFLISRGATESITIIGGPDCAFIAAFAYWVLGLSVYVEDEDESLIFTSVSTKESAQVKVHYAKIEQRSRMEVASSTYHLGDHREMLGHTERTAIFDLVARTAWESCFTRVFGRSFKRLIGIPNLLGTFLGSAARIATAMSTGEAKREGLEFDCDRYINFVEASYGKGFIESVTAIFPEFSEFLGLVEHMRLAEEVSLPKARDTIEQTMRPIKLLCGCLECSSHSPVGGEGVSRNTPRACLVCIISTIRRLVTSLSCAEKDPELKPTVSGIEIVYDSVYSIWSLKGTRDEDFLSLSLDTYRDEHYHLLEDIQTFFLGTTHQTIMTMEQPTRNWHYCTATSQGGLCVYLDALQSLSGRAELMRKVHVRRGHIQWNDRLYDSVWDALTWSNETEQVLQCDKASSQDSFSGALDGDGLEVKAFVTERASGSRLYFYYRAFLPHGGGISLQPGALTETVLRRTGHLFCERFQCGGQLAMPCSRVRRGWAVNDSTADLLQFLAGVACCIWPLGNNIARCVAIQMIRDADTDCRHTMFLRRSECLPCCTLEILRQSRELISHAQISEARGIAYVVS